MRNFTFAMKWHEILKPYSEEIRREVYDAVIEYAATGTIIEMQPLSRMAFDFIRYEIDEKAKRKAARLAKKQQIKEDTQSQEVEYLTNLYYNNGQAPIPFTVRQAGVKITMTESRIRDLVKKCVADLIEQGQNTKHEQQFLISLDPLVKSRCEAIHQQLKKCNTIEKFSDEHCWVQLIQNVHTLPNAG